MTEIRLANERDREFWFALDKHIAAAELEKKLRESECYVLVADGVPAGILRYNLFWDNTPFMNLLYVLEEYRGKGVGKELTAFWEGEMVRQGFEVFITSTQSDEYAQHFYRKLGYRDVGGFQFPGESFELIFVKEKKDDSL